MGYDCPRDDIPVWRREVDYAPGDLVRHAGRVWRALTHMRGVAPDSEAVLHGTDGYLTAAWRQED